MLESERARGFPAQAGRVLSRRREVVERTREPIGARQNSGAARREPFSGAGCIQRCGMNAAGPNRRAVRIWKLKFLRFFARFTFALALSLKAEGIRRAAPESVCQGLGSRIAEIGKDSSLATWRVK